MDTQGSSRAPGGRVVGPSAVGQLMRDRSLRLAAALAVAVAIPVAVLFYFQFRSLSNLGRSSALVLRQLSQESADGLTKSIEDALKAPHIETLLRITQAQTEPLNLPFIERAFEDSLDRSGFVSRFYVWSDATDVHRDELLVMDREHRGLYTGRPEADALLTNIRDFAPRKRAIVAFEMNIDGRRAYVQAQLRFVFPARDRLTSFVAFAVDAEQLRHRYFPDLLRTKLQAWQTPTGFPPLVASVLDDQSHVLFPRGASAAMPYVDERSFPLVFFDKELIEYAAPYDVRREGVSVRPEVWRLRVGYGGQSITQIIEARARPQRAMMAVLAGVMALGVFFVARAAAREVRVAEMKSNFVSSVSHDLKTPLALIQLFAETLELGRLKNTDRAQEYYRIINSEARKLTRLINNILDFSRIEAGLRKYKAEPTDLAQMTSRVLDSLASQFRQNQFTVTSHVAPNVPPVLIDPEAAEQALENLLSNAMKYSPEHREIRVEVDALDGFGRVRVTDHGVGIPPRFQRKIFRKFYRIQHDAGSGPQGTGLGLAIVDHIMRAHNGFVGVDSEPGRGSTFTLHFPLYAEAHGDQTNTGDRGRAADVARSA
ncbi:MAG: sensor histidine kinase [Betaproteobacteria bacterium]